MTIATADKRGEPWISPVVFGYDKNSLSSLFKKTFESFLKEYKLLQKEKVETKNQILYRAEKLMTWENILTHRANLI